MHARTSSTHVINECIMSVILPLDRAVMLQHLRAWQAVDVIVSVQGKQYLSQTQTVAPRSPVRIAAVLRTTAVWVDRIKVRAAYQAMDVLP